MQKTDITVIITIWKRNYLEEQLESLLQQTLLPVNVFVLQNERHQDVEEIISRYKQHFTNLALVRSDHNFKYFFRFSIAALSETTYTFLIDDDVIPGKKWLETCVEKCKQYNAVIACSGRVIPAADYRMEDWEKFDEAVLPGYFIGNYNTDQTITYNFCEKDTMVDYGCNSYFFKTAWIRHFWSVWPCTYASGEDIHLSASLKIAAGINTYVPAQLNEETSGNLRKAYGTDAVASWVQPGFVSIRESIFRHLIDEKSWTPILWPQKTRTEKMVLTEH
jgi:hypothetical protein